MKRCSVKPYEGNEKFIFISYCHKDRAYVFPIIEQLVKDGFRVWYYDEGIDPGAEWPEIIAKHLNDCATCIAFISENSLNSHNCRREINFALLKKKPFISVALEPVEMSLGMEMQLSAFQSIFKYKLETEVEFFKKLYEAKQLNDCLGAPCANIVVSQSSDYLSDDFDTSKVRDPFSSSWFMESTSKDNADESDAGSASVEEQRLKVEEEARIAAENLRKKTEEAERLKKLEEERIAAEEARKKAEEAERIAAEKRRHDAEEAARLAAEELEKKKTEAERLRQLEAERAAAERKREEAEAAARMKAEAELNQHNTNSIQMGTGNSVCQAEKQTDLSEQNNRRADSSTKFMLKREKTGQIIRILYGSHVIGRSETLADYYIEGNRMIGRTHATLIASEKECVIVDNRSLNKTCINGAELEPNIQYALRDGDVLKIANELFAFYSS